MIKSKKSMYDLLEMSRADFEHKITMLKFAFTSYQKLINSLIQLLDNDEVDFKEFNTKLETTDQIIIDRCISIPSKFNGIYHKKQKKIEANKNQDDEQIKRRYLNKYMVYVYNDY